MRSPRKPAHEGSSVCNDSGRRTRGLLIGGRRRLLNGNCQHGDRELGDDASTSWSPRFADKAATDSHTAGADCAGSQNGDKRVLAELRTLASGQRRIEAALADLRVDIDAALKGGMQTPHRYITESPSANSDECDRTAGTGRLANSCSVRGARSNAQSSVNGMQSIRGHHEGALSMSLDHEAIGGERSDAEPVGTDERLPKLSEWPATIMLRERLYDLRSASSVALPVAPRGDPTDGPQRRQSFMGRGSLDDLAKGRCLHDALALNPESKCLIPHKVLLVLIMMHDMVAIPYILAWEIPFKGEALHLAEVAVAFWVWDLFLSCFEGFYRDGELERRLVVVFQAYFRTWFFPDGLAIVCDWISLHETVASRMGTRFALRVPGLLRAHKLIHMYNTALDKVLSEKSRMVIQFTGIVLFLFWLNHIICCTWYSIGQNAPTDTGGRWLDSLDYTGIENFDGSHTLYQYVTSFHWSIGSITAGGVENLFALNSYERSFSIMVLVGGLLVFSSLISSFSATLTQLKLIEQEKTQKMRNLREYLGQNAVSELMCIRVQRQVAERMRRRTRLIEKDVKALSMLSSTLRAQLQWEITGPHLKRHPLLRVFSIVDLQTVQDVCGEAVDRTLKMSGDNLFVAGGPPAKEAYLILSGRLEYLLRASSGLVEEDLRKDLTAGTWLCEVALWTHWTHVGSADAVEPSDLLLISVDALLKELLKNGVIGTIAREYSRQFHARLVAAKPPRAMWPNDVEVPFTDYGELVLSMSPQLQTLVGTITLEDVRHHHLHSFPPGAFEKLELEVSEQKCAIMMNSSGELERAVTLIVLHLKRSDGRILVQVGKYSLGEVVSVCQLPGAKQGQRGGPEDAIERLLNRLSPLVGSTRFTHAAEREIQWKDSPTFNLRTRYLRAVHYAEVDKPPRGRVPPVPVLDSAPDSQVEIFGLRQELDTSAFDFYTWMTEEDLPVYHSEGGTRHWLDALDLDALPAVCPESLGCRDSRESRDWAYQLDRPKRPDGTDSSSSFDWLLAPAEAGVIVTIVSASGLVSSEMSASIGPYCKCAVEGKRGSYIKTRVARNSSDPIWNSEHRLGCAELGDVLLFEVWVSEPEPKMHVLLGRASLGLAPEKVSDIGVLEADIKLEGDATVRGLLHVRVAGIEVSPRKQQRKTDGGVESSRVNGNAKPLTANAVEKLFSPLAPEAAELPSPFAERLAEGDNWVVPEIPRPRALPPGGLTTSALHAGALPAAGSAPGHGTSSGSSCSSADVGYRTGGASVHSAHRHPLTTPPAVRGRSGSHSTNISEDRSEQLKWRSAVQEYCRTNVPTPGGRGCEGNSVPSQLQARDHMELLAVPSDPSDRV